MTEQTKRPLTAADFAGYEEAGEEVSIASATLADVQALAQEMANAERDVAAKEAAMRDALVNLAKIKEQKLPDLMEAACLPRFDFVDRHTGETYTLKLDTGWRVSMPSKSGPTADPNWLTKHRAIFAWAREIGQGGIVKRDLEIPLGHLAEEQAAALAAEFKTLHPDLDPGLTEFVEPATFGAMVKRLLEGGQNVHEFVTVKPKREAKVSNAGRRARR